MQAIRTLFFLFVLPGLLLAEDTDDDMAKLQAEIEHNLVAPCCWTMTVDQHESAAAHKVREQIAALLQEGKTKEEILAYLSSPSQYGERILAKPAPKGFLGKSAYWLVPLAFVAGAIIVGIAIRRLTRPQELEVSLPDQTAQVATSGDASKWEKKVEEELKKLDL